MWSHRAKNTCTQVSKLNKNCNFYHFVKDVLKWIGLFASAGVWWKYTSTVWCHHHNACAKVPAVLPIITIASLLQMSTQWKDNKLALLWTNGLMELLKEPCCCPGVSGPYHSKCGCGIIGIAWKLWIELQILTFTLDLLNPTAFNMIPRWFPYTLKAWEGLV